MSSRVEVSGSAGTARNSLHYPWLLIGLLWCVSFLNAADRSIVVAVLPHLREEFALTATQLALVNSIFFWVYAVAAFACGQLGDRLRRTSIIIGGLAFWSIATGLVPLSTGFAMLLASRALVALGESAYYPAATALISDWHRPQMRSRALSLHQTAVFAGGGLGAFFAGFIADRLGWRAPFLLFGVIGLLFCLVLLKWLRDAPRVTLCAAHAKENQGASPLRSVLRQPAALMLCGVFFLANGASTGVLVWAPTYVHDAVGLNLADSALYGAATISIAGFLAVPLGGWLADTFAAKTPIGRFHTLAIGLTLAALFLLPLTVASTAAAVGAVLLASSIGKGLFDGCIYAAMHDVVPAQARATAVGLMTMLGFIGGGLTPIFVAHAGEVLGMAAGLASLAILYFIATAVLLLTRSTTLRAVLDTRRLEQA